jgi:hypothetical protein
VSFQLPMSTLGSWVFLRRDKSGRSTCRHVVRGLPLSVAGS